MAEAEEPRPWVGQDSRARHEHEHRHEYEREHEREREDGHGRRPEHDRTAPDGPRERPGSDGERLLQRRLGTSDRAERFYDEQVLDHLNERMREFVQRQEMFFLATADASGECDSSFRAGPAGFLQVLGERALAYPEYRGNGVHASLGNIEENPHLGIMLIDFARARIGLHINGRATLVEDERMRASHPDLPEDPVPGRRAQLWVHVEVEEAYIHCAKHIPQMQKAPRRTARDWGTDDYKRKGGDFFGAARDAREREAVETGGAREHSGRVEAAEPAGSAEPAAPAEPAVVAEPAESAASADPVESSWPAASARLSALYEELTGHAREEKDPQPYTAVATDVPQGTAETAGTSEAPGRRWRPPEPRSQPAPSLSVPEQRRAPGPRWPETSPPRPQPSDVSPEASPAAPPEAQEQTGATATDGASGALAARGAQSAGSRTSGTDPQSWREQAERALAEAQRRGAAGERGTFQGWFG